MSLNPHGLLFPNPARALHLNHTWGFAPKNLSPQLGGLAVNYSHHREDNKITIMNDGKGIPVEMHKEHDMYVPTLIFGHLLTSSNFDDEQKKVWSPLIIE